MSDWYTMQEAHKASNRLRAAVKVGKLTRGQECELCGYNRERWEKDFERHSKEYISVTGKRLDKASYRSFRIVGHHWRGYDYPLDVWWICCSCNRRLAGWHDGRLNKDEARLVVGISGRS